MGCVLEGVSKDKYENTYGVQQIQDGVKVKFVTQHEYGTNVGSRLYVMDDDDKYKLFYLKNREFSFEVDVSELQCGMNGAVINAYMADLAFMDNYYFDRIIFRTSREIEQFIAFVRISYFTCIF